MTPNVLPEIVPLNNANINSDSAVSVPRHNSANKFIRPGHRANMPQLFCPLFMSNPAMIA